MNFSIQTINGQVKHDFSFTLLEALAYHQWLGYGSHTFSLTDHIPKVGIPVGSVEFVSETLKSRMYPVPKPKNVPVELRHFAGRTILDGNENSHKRPGGASWFVKSNDVIKYPTRFVDSHDLLDVGRYQFSSIVDFETEWRAFVWRGQLVGLQNYAGDFCLFPEVSRIRKMIKAYVDAPCAYTLDVGIVNGETCLVEVHDFFSCGLYGFADLQLLPLMLGGWYKEYIKSRGVQSC